MRLSPLILPSLRYFSIDPTKQPNIYDGYRQMTNEEKQARQRERRLAKSGANQQQSITEFAKRANDTIDRLHAAFVQLAKENDKGWITIERSPTTLSIKVGKIGQYMIVSNPTSLTFSL